MDDENIIVLFLRIQTANTRAPHCAPFQRREIRRDKERTILAHLSSKKASNWISRLVANTCFDVCIRSISIGRSRIPQSLDILAPAHGGFNQIITNVILQAISCIETLHIDCVIISAAANDNMGPSRHLNLHQN